MRFRGYKGLVTLHVSVWVEIKIWLIKFRSLQSRSTWACELKLISSGHWAPTNGHAPRERVSWNVPTNKLGIKEECHAPRERVSWNTSAEKIAEKLAVTLHVSVWVEIAMALAASVRSLVTLHVSVWVEIMNSMWMYKFTVVTLHVSVWVEINICF